MSTAISTVAKILKKVSSTEKLMDSSPANYKAVHKVGKFTSLTKLLPLRLTPLLVISSSSQVSSSSLPEYKPMAKVGSFKIFRD